MGVLFTYYFYWWVKNYFPERYEPEEEDGLLAVISEGEAPHVEIVNVESTDLYGDYDGAPFCLIESCCLEVKMAGDRVVFDGTNYEIKDLFSLIDDFGVRSAQVTEFKSEHDYRCDFCVFGEIDPDRPWIGRVLS